MLTQNARLQSPWSPPSRPVSKNNSLSLQLLLRPPLAPRSGCSQATPKLHTTLSQSCPPSEAKSTFHKTRPHSQVGSQPLIWKKRGLLVLSSSKSDLHCTLHVALPPLPVFYDFQGLKGPSPPVSNRCSATQARTGPM